MKRAAALVLAASAACASASKQADLPGVPRGVDPSLAVFTENGQAGHACPVGGAVYSARHVFWNDEERRFMGATWSSQSQDGYAVVAGFSPVKDLVQLELVGGEVAHLKPGEAEPGERVYWFEYDFRTKANALRGRRRFATVLRLVAQQYVLDESPVGGASGTCLISERGEVAGVVVGGWETDDGSLVGVAVMLPKSYGE